MDAHINTVIPQLAKGSVDLYRFCVLRGLPVSQDASAPSSIRRALSLVSKLCILDGVEDIGASVHVALNFAARPVRDWGIPSLSAATFPYADVVLVEGDAGVPSLDCWELARAFSGEEDILEDLQHKKLRETSKSIGGQANKVYALIREFIIRNPVVSLDDLNSFIVANALAAKAQDLYRMWREIPVSLMFSDKARRCAGCGSLLRPHTDKAAYPDGFCDVRRCREIHPTPSCSEEIPDPVNWRLADPGILAYWVSPGIDEIRVYDLLKRGGKKVELYPLGDAADIGIDGSSIGIDLKAYSSPIVLGQKLTHSIGRLSLFKERVIGIPDERIALNSLFLKQLAQEYHGGTPLRFMSISQILKEYGK